MRGVALFRVQVASAFAAAAAIAACRDLSSFSTAGDHFEGVVVSADFVRTGVDLGTRVCMTLDADHLQDTPGLLWSSDGRFRAAPLRPIPQIWHDPLSTLSFGEGRLKNLLYVATASAPFGDGNGNDVFAVVSLMQSGRVELRLLRSTPSLAADGSTPGAGGGVFAVFDLSRGGGPCSS
ncbi:MAG: hypothetical protein M3O50_03180 [Myxococcota bacterium]|nr:hypothetical protein [Myxococcota bacterium]